MRATDSFATPPTAILWQRTIGQQLVISQVVAAVDSLRTASGTQGCTESNVMLRLDPAGVGGRRIMISGLTMLGYGDFLGARYASYPEMLDVLRPRRASGKDLARTVFERIVFNIIIGNTDDHARNHAAFWDGRCLELAPANDL